MKAGYIKVRDINSYTLGKKKRIVRSVCTTPRGSSICTSIFNDDNSNASN